MTTDRGAWRARAVVIATGYCDAPRVPAWAGNLSADVVPVTPTTYRRPDMLPPGGVLIVGASACGIQPANEIHASGRPVTIAVGRHTRLPRRYRGRDILWWLDRMGVPDATPTTCAISRRRGGNLRCSSLERLTAPRSISPCCVPAASKSRAGRLASTAR